MAAIAGLAKREIDKRGGVQQITQDVRREYERRGGSEGLKSSARSVADAARKGSTSSEKLKAAAAAAQREMRSPTAAEAKPAKRRFRR